MHLLGSSTSWPSVPIKTLKLFIASRVIILGCAFISSWGLLHHDFSDCLIYDTSFLSFLLRWDALHFLRIANKGYTTESIIAFFPLLPWMIRTVSEALRTTPLLAGTIISNCMFLVCTETLFWVTKRHLTEEIAWRSCFLFCFSPCSVLFSSLYSESVFSALVMISIFCILEGNEIFAALSLSLCAGARANGFLLFPLLGITSRAYNRSYMGYLRYKKILLGGLPIGVFFGIQLYWWKKRFSYLKWGLPYSYVQGKYWEQGFLRFYADKKNIPNIIVGAPFVILSLCVSGNYFYREKDKLIWQLRKKTLKGYLTPIRAISFFLHMLHLFQTFLSVFFIHMNMHFRFISFNPILYWGVSRMAFSDRFLSKALLFGWIAFGVGYAVLYGAYFPPA